MADSEKRARPKSSGALYKKGAMVVLALVLLVSAVVYLTTAWYTKMVSVSGMTFQAAKWDFTANYSVDSMTVNVFEYTTLNKDKAAPGTAGYVPVYLSALQSDTDIVYQLSVSRDTMSEEFVDRIFFYYLKDENGTHTPENKVYFGGSPQNPGSHEEVIMEGTIEKGKSTTAIIYWEWIYEAPRAANETDETYAAKAKAWDEFDTKVGKNPEVYVSDMNATISVAGVEIEHNPPTNTDVTG